MNRSGTESPRAEEPVSASDAARSANTLALLYQGLLTATVRVRSGRQQIADAEAFRGRTMAALRDVERDGIAAGYDSNDIKETHFAVVAFLDWVILNSSQPIRADWERRSLQQDLFGHAHAGDVFFEKLNRISERRDTPGLADILEVFLLCLLLGFQGRYAGASGTQADGIAETVRHRIDHIRGEPPSLWPGGPAPGAFQPEPSVAARPKRQLLYAALSAAGFAVLLFALLKSNLEWLAADVRAGFM
jgi:type VI secretion system protein ImpK